VKRHGEKGQLSHQDVVAFLAEARGAKSLREMARELSLNHRQRKELKRIIGKLKHKKEIEEVQSGRFRLPGTRFGAAAGSQQSSRKPAPSTPAKNSQGRPGETGETPGRGTDPNLVTGRLVAHRDGFGFVVPEEPVPGMEGDLFIPPNQMGDAMHGDRVAARIEKRGPQGGRFEGRLLRILKRANPRVVGVFRAATHRLHPREASNRVSPFDPRMGEIFILSDAGERGSLTEPAGSLDGMVVNVELTRFPHRGVSAAGRVVEVLGRPGELGVDTEIIIRKHQLPFEFPEEVQEETLVIPESVSEAAAREKGRHDFRALPIVTIDGETAKDFDDAVHVARLPHGYALQVHIADVSYYVRRNAALDREARLRGTSVYFPGRAVPMLPEALSNGVCSLNPGVDRLVMSALMEFDAHGKMTRTEFTPGVIRSAERMTYTNVNKVLEGDPEMSARYAAQAEHFRLMRELALILNKKRERRGSIDFDLPEPVIEFDEQNRMRNITRSERNIAHRIIEEFMLAANEAVAAYLEKRGFASLHRVHEPPDPKKVIEFEQLARAFGYSLGVADLVERRVPLKHGKREGSAKKTREGVRHGGRPMEVLLPADEIDIRPQHYQNLVKKIEGKPEERILSYLMLRSLKQARYAAEPLGHFALGAKEYTHFTSPIRRYPDLIVHRVLKWALEKERGQEVRKSGSREKPIGPYPVVELEEIAAESSDSERRADAAERELMDWKTAQFMEEHLGDEYEALIISVQKFGFFVELMEVFVEGLVPMSMLEEFSGERCTFRESDRSIVAPRRRIVFRLGDRVRVRAERIEPMLRRVEFALLGKLETRK
jgi:ribonuclease R